MAIADELEELARDDFAAKDRLNLEADELRFVLAQISEKDDELLKSWASHCRRYPSRSYRTGPCSCSPGDSHR